MRPSTPTPTRTAFTLIDLMVTLTVIVVAAAIVIPQLRDDTRLRLIAAAHVLTSDIELAQVMTITSPDKEVVVTFQPASARYMLAYAATPNTPLQDPDTQEDYVVEFGQGRARAAIGVTMGLTDVGGDVLAFNAQGGLDDPNKTPKITLAAGSNWIRLEIAPTTGTITEVMSP